MLAAIALVFSRHGQDWAVVVAVAAVVGSFLVSYTRAQAEALGLKGDVGLGSRAERVVAHHRRARLRAVGRPAVGDRRARRDGVAHGRPARPARPQATFRRNQCRQRPTVRARLDDGKVRVAIVGVGNCANSLLQGVEYYKDAPDDQFVPGLMHVNLGGYHVRDIEFTAAFDVVKGKVGEDLADAIWAHPNDTIKFADVPKTGIKVSRGMTHDGLGKYLSQVVEKAHGKTDDVVGILKETKTDVVVNYLPVGSEAATKWYAEQILEAGCAMVNCMPVFIAREDYWGKRFEEKGLPIIGDDIKSQVGATITHRVLTSLFRERGVHLDKTMQLNVGGNSDFLNMLERERLESKKISKTNAVTSMLDYDLGAGNVHVGPSDYVPWLTDRKWAYIRMEGSVVRRRAAQRRAQARGLGLAELGRHRDRRRPAGEARAQQRRRRRARRPELVPDEVAAEADRRRRGVRADRGVHPRERAGRGEARGGGGGLDPMVARAVSARDWLTPLAVLIPILATVVAAFVALVPGTPGICD